MTDTLNPQISTRQILTRQILTREERAELRQRQYRRRRLIGWIVIASVLVFGTSGTYLVRFTSVLGLKNVAVTQSAGELTPELDSEVRAAVGVADGTPLISLDLEAIAQRVEALPEVADASTSRGWPGTLNVSVTTRVPVAVVAANSALYLIDGQGHPYVIVADKPADLVTLRLATPGPDDVATQAGVAVVQALTPELKALLTSVSARSPYNITLELTDGRTVIWGGSADNARKTQILPAVLAQPGTTYDISDPAMVTVR